MNTEIVDKIIIGRVEPHIYAFETNTVPNYLKIGDTYRPVEERLKEWRHHFEDLVKLYEHEARIDERYFRDLEVHKFVEREKLRSRITRDKFPNLPYFSNEFFENAIPDDIDEAIDDIKKSAVDNDGRYQFYSMNRIREDFHFTRDEKPLPLRPNQEETVKRFKEAIKNKRTHLLMYAVMRFGKTFTSLCCAQQIENLKLVLVVSAKAGVISEWQKNVEKCKNFEEFQFVTSKQLKRNHNLVKDAFQSKQKIVVCLTLQDLNNTEIKEHHKQLFEEDIDLLIVDETHYGARADHYGSVLNSSSTKRPSREKKYDAENLEDALEQAKKLKSKIQLHLSGTPYRILMGSEFTDKDIISFCQYSDIIEARDKWFSDNLDAEEDKEEGKKEEWDNPYYGFPQMVRFAFNLNSSSLKKIEELRKAGISTVFRELFGPLSVQKDESSRHKLFKHEKEVFDFLKAIDNSQDGENIFGFLNNKRIKDGDLCRHIVMVLPYCASCDAMEALIKKHVSDFDNLSEYEILNIVGFEQDGKFRRDADVVRKITDCESKNQKTLTLTVNRMLTGSTVPEWDTMIYLKDTVSPQEYDQAIFRLQNPYTQTYTNEEGKTFKRNLKPQTLLVDFDPDRMFFLQELRAHIYDINTDSYGNRNLLERIEKELKVSPVIWLNKDKLQEVTPNDILKFIRDYSSKRSILDEASDIPVDMSLLDIPEIRDEIMRQHPVGSKGGLKIKPAKEPGEDDIDIDDDEDTLPDSGEKPKSKKNEEEDDVDDISKRIVTYYSRFLFFAFLTKDDVMSIQDIVNAVDSNVDNMRIAKNLAINVPLLSVLLKHINPHTLRELEYKIQNIHELASDTRYSHVERVERAIRSYGRWSNSEVVTPNDLALSMLNKIPHDRIRPDSKFLDIASKTGEFAYAILQVFGDTYRDKIYSIPTSSIAYEFTRRVYESLDMPIENILDKYNTYDLRGEKSEEIINELKNMGITVAVGNPPYQDEGGSGGTNDAPIYQEFCDVAKIVTRDFSTMIIPSKWFTGGREHLLGAFRKEMLTSGKIVSMSAFTDAGDVFPNVEIKGGVCHYLSDRLHEGKCNYSLNRGGVESFATLNLGEYDVLIREPQLALIVSKVLKQVKLDGSDFVENYISSDTPFGIPTNPEKSKKTRYEVSDAKRTDNDVLLYYLKGSKRVVEYIDRNLITKNAADIDSIKVFVPAAYGASESFPHQILGVPEYAPSGSVCSQTYLYLKFDSENEARNFISYLKTRFFRALVAAIKITQHAQTSVYHFVPMQDLTHSWTDDDLYKKYDLSPDEVKYIDSMIKPMAKEAEEFKFE
jgi:hypothetical protein